MRVSSLIAGTTLVAVGLVLVGTVALEHGLSYWLLDENELPVSRRAAPPNMLTKYMIWIQRTFFTHDDNVCHVYLAESSIPNAGMGVYTAIDLDARQQVGSPELVIPITLAEEHFRHWKVWSNYVWAARVPDIDSNQAAFIPGIASSINSHYWDLTNLYVVGKAHYDTAQLHRTADVGAGAFTPWKGARTNAYESISAGAELFSYYGEQYFAPKPYAVETRTFEDADMLVSDFEEFVQNHDDTLTMELKEAIWKDLVQEFPVSFHQSGYGAVQTLPQRTWEELNEEEQESPSISLEVTRQGHKRSIDWLKETGYCMDWMEEGISSIPQAGRGAFARRFIPKGTVVSLAPLLHIADTKVTDWSHDTVKRELVRNYSFGNKHSSLLLTPHGVGVGLMNHDARRSNINLQWPTTKLATHDPSFLELPPSALSRQGEIRLSLEYVTTRNIYPGEELLLDYGPDWEAAWDRHIRTWRPQTEWYVHPSQVNKVEPIRTQAETGYDPYPPNLYLECQVSYNNNHVYTAPPPEDEVEWERCEVMSRNGYTYRVRLEESDMIVEQVPHNAIVFQTRHAMSDWALPAAFRHEIGLPDYLVPDVWRDKEPASCCE